MLMRWGNCSITSWVKLPVVQPQEKPDKNDSFLLTMIDLFVIMIVYIERRILASSLVTQCILL